MDAISHLQNLLRLNTTNPPGNEILAAAYLADVLRQAGYDPIVLESAPGRGNVIVRYRGDGSQAPLLLYNHLDVVPVEPEHWTHDPFGGEISDGFIWGRGALDMKNIVTQQLMVMLRLAAQQPALKRDVIFAGCADEEVSGKMGLGFLARSHPDLIAAEIGLSESGAIPLYLGEHTLYPIQCGERGTCTLILRAYGAPGHGAAPNYETAAIRFLALALARLTQAPLPTHMVATVANQLTYLAPLLAADPADLINPDRFQDTLAQVPSPLLRQSLTYVTRHSASPNILRAGAKINVVPSVAEAHLDGRYLPGFTPADLIAEIQTRIGPDLPVEVVHVMEDDTAALETPSSGPIWDALVRNLERHDPGCIAIPTMLAGATDAKHLAPLGIRTYGFSPMRFPPDFDWRNLVHGHDERIPVAALDWGIDVLFDTVLDLCR